MNQRLDAALAERGLARSRTHAHQLITAGDALVNGVKVMKAAAAVTDTDTIEVTGVDQYVSRAAPKLANALDAFGLDVRGRFALDAGASTGGFTQVLLERGIDRVIALDVGHGQLSPRIRTDDRVIVVEGENVRDLTPQRVRSFPTVETLPNMVVADLSFISLGIVLPALVASSTTDAEYVLLIKPQFEVGRTGIREGVVRDRAGRADAVERVLWSAHDAGLRTAGLEQSSLLGAHGNIEVVAWFSHTSGSTPTEWTHRIREVTA